MHRALMLFLLAMVSSSFASSGQYLLVDESPVRLIDGDLIALPVESGIDILSLPGLSPVDHIDVVWPDRQIMTMNNGKIAYIEKEGEGETLKVYDLKTKVGKTIKTAEKRFYGNVVLSDDFVGYCEGEDLWDSKLYISSVDGSEISENFFASANRFKDSWGNLFVIRGVDFIGVYDPLEQKVIASTSLRKDNPYAVSIDGGWVVYTEAVMGDDVGRDIWLWNYLTGEERLVSKGVDGKEGIWPFSKVRVDRQDDSIVSGDTVVWFKYNNASGKYDPAVYSYSIEKNETRLVKKGQFSPIDLEGNTLLLRGYENETYTYLLYDLSTGRQTDVKRP
ncbi:MAG: hypothetical protein SVE93_07995 [Candidatus Thermoplasmatota archaeon]|nr:hypothetical protein [Candidatus Thermoplasmatota archaeon]